jgi:Copper binding proteins, plastocyanin/azurin family
MRDFSFSPATVTVDAGDSVTWTNGGREPHTATGDGFDTGRLGPGESGSASFSRAGSFSYVCSIHPNMQGTVRVAASGEGGGGADRPRAGGGTDGETGSSSEPGSPQASGADEGAAGGPTLPASGLDAGLLGILGVALVALGIALRRRTAEG